MANMASKIRFPVDGLAFLQPEGVADVTGAGAAPSDNVMSLDELQSYWDLGELAFNQQAAIAIVVTALDFTTMDETYVLAIEVDSEEAFGDAPVIVTEVEVFATGEYALAFTREQIVEMDPDATHVRILATLAGTTPILNYNARVVPFPGN